MTVPLYIFCICISFYLTVFFFQMVIAFNITQVEPVSFGKYKYPSWANGMGWVISISSAIPIPVCAIIAVFVLKGSFVQV